MSQWDGFRGSLERAHDSFEFPEAEFENWTGSTYDPDEGEMTGGTWSSTGTVSVEFVPPAVDSTVDVGGGTTLEFDTSLRLPETDLDRLSDDIVPYGADAEKPTRIDVEGSRYEVQSATNEHGSGMVLLRVAEV